MFKTVRLNYPVYILANFDQCLHAATHYLELTRYCTAGEVPTTGRNASAQPNVALLRVKLGLHYGCMQPSHCVNQA